VQIHVPDTRAPKVISMVGTMQNLVNEVLQAAVGNHFRNTLQALEAVKFIETRGQVQESALEAITAYLAAYDVETRGVYIQDVEFPAELVVVLTQREMPGAEWFPGARLSYAEHVFRHVPVEGDRRIGVLERLSLRLRPRALRRGRCRGDERGHERRKDEHPETLAPSSRVHRPLPSQRFLAPRWETG